MNLITEILNSFSEALKLNLNFENFAIKLIVIHIKNFYLTSGNDNFNKIFLTLLLVLLDNLCTGLTS